MPIFVPGVERSMAVSVVPLVTCKILSVFLSKVERERKKEREREECGQQDFAPCTCRK
jgi:hypothetical protein